MDACSASYEGQGISFNDVGTTSHNTHSCTSSCSFKPKSSYGICHTTSISCTSACLFVQSPRCIKGYSASIYCATPFNGINGEGQSYGTQEVACPVVCAQVLEESEWAEEALQVSWKVFRFPLQLLASCLCMYSSSQTGE
mmetsp:Transcript_144431/g.266337  ORF Transcript_144431/g.266337 Transcript_144431/m.266337 type:complete len:140 (-) Transcript_144431:14-433(-)